MEVEELLNGEDDSDFELDEDDLRALSNEESVSQSGTTNAIKEGLRLKIQTRRISEGQGELKVEFEPPKAYELTPEEKRKIEIRKRRNRRSADQSRIKRKRKLESLIKDEKELVEANQKLKAEVEALGKFKEKMESVLRNHLPNCRNAILNDTVKPNGIYDARKVSDASGSSQELTHVNASICETVGKDNGFPKLGRTDIHTLSKEQKIAMLKAYLKGNQTNPEIQKMTEKIREITRIDTTA